MTPAEGPDSAALAELLQSAEPGLMTRGRFSIYKTEDGGLHIAYQLDGQAEDGHLPVPGGIVRMALAAMTGKGPMAMLLGKLGGGG